SWGYCGSRPCPDYDCLMSRVRPSSRFQAALPAESGGARRSSMEPIAARSRYPRNRSPPPPPRLAIVPRTSSLMRVLMFGWEFSPFQAGGLATATLGLVKGLLNRGTEVTLVVPFSLSAASDVPNLRLVSAADPRPALRSIRVDSPLAPYAGAEEYQVLSEQGAKGTR